MKMVFFQIQLSKIPKLSDICHYCKIVPHVQGNRESFAEKIVVQEERRKENILVSPDRF